MSWLALDIGGANLKVADGAGYAASREFFLWQRSRELAAELSEMIAEAPAARRIAVTMTGELADCFATKAEGVGVILDAVEQAAAGREVFVYLCGGELATPPAARAKALLAGASNWHASGAFSSRFCADGSGLLVDVGSTTTDIVPLSGDGPRAVGQTDPERLVTGELVYTGIERSPLCGIVRTLPWRGEACAVAQELFATAADAYLILGELEGDEQNTKTADGRPSTKPHAHARLARSICADTTMFSWDDAQRAAAAVRDAQLDLLESAARRVLGRLEVAPQTFVLAGHGEFVGRWLLERLGYNGAVISLSEELGPQTSRCATAHALAVLARERFAE
jgi:probable H4MPT-linked C1 transfer pathway protein